MAVTFPNLVKEAAEKFRNYCTAFTQFKLEGGNAQMRLQAMEIMQEFVGSVDYGIDPKGLLFYNNAKDFFRANAEFKYYSWGERPNFKIVKVDFTKRGDPDHIFARFVANVDPKYHIPLNPTAGGKGRFKNFEVAASLTIASRQEGSDTLFLQLAPINKEVYFKTRSRTAIENIPGILMFPDNDKLKDEPLSGRKLLAQYAEDRIVFSLEPRQGDPKPLHYGLFLPDTLLKDIGTQQQPPPETKWSHFEHENTYSSLTVSEAPEDDD